MRLNDPQRPEEDLAEVRLAGEEPTSLNGVRVEDVLEALRARWEQGERPSRAAFGSFLAAVSMPAGCTPEKKRELGRRGLHVAPDAIALPSFFLEEVQSGPDTGQSHPLRGSLRDLETSRKEPMAVRFAEISNLEVDDLETLEEVVS